MKQDEIVKETDPRSYRLVIEASKDGQNWIEIQSFPSKRFESPSQVIDVKRWHHIRLRVTKRNQKEDTHETV